MKKYELWDRVSPINNVEASYFLNQEPFKSETGDIILIYGDNERVSNVECKSILASVYGIDVNLPLDEFMNAYFGKLEEQNEVEVPTEEIV
jgi:hypothetical protein